MKYLLIFLHLLCQSLYGQVDYLIEDIKLFDGYELKERVDLLIEEGIIQRIGEIKAESKDLVIISGRGKTIVPGMVNCHVHAWLPYHLKNAMQAGVFAVLDMHTSVHPDSLNRYKLEDGYARFFSTGYAATVPGGHGTQYGFEVPTIGADRSPSQFVQESVARGSDYIKIIYEPQKPTLSIDQINEIVKTSKNEGLLSVAHISSRGGAKDLIDTGIDGFVHMWKDAPASQSFLDSISARGMFVVPTVSVMEGIIEYYRQNRIRVPFSQLEMLLDEVARLHQSGIRLLAGTDPPNVGLDYGSSLHNELRLYVQAGLSPLAALKTATSSPNEIFSLGDIGVIREGQLANFNLIDGDPLLRMEEISQMESIWAGGKKIK